MKTKIRNRKDLWAGLIFLFFGLFTLAINRNYPMGSGARMGPGFFPFVLGIILALLGFLIAICSLREEVEEVHRLAIRPLVLVLGSVIAFSILINPFGLALAILGLVFISSIAGTEFRFREIIILYFVLAAIAIGVFVYILELPFKVWFL